MHPYIHTTLKLVYTHVYIIYIYNIGDALLGFATSTDGDDTRRFNHPQSFEPAVVFVVRRKANHLPILKVVRRKAARTPASTATKSYAQVVAKPSPAAKPAAAPATQHAAAAQPVDALAQLIAQMAALTQAVNAGQVTMSALQADIVKMKSEFSGEVELSGDAAMATGAGASDLDPIGKGGKHGKGKVGHGTTPY